MFVQPGIIYEKSTRWRRRLRRRRLYLAFYLYKLFSPKPQDTKESCNDVEEVSPALYSPVAQHQPAAIAQHCLASVFNPDLSCLDYRKKWEGLSFHT